MMRQGKAWPMPVDAPDARGWLASTCTLEQKKIRRLFWKKLEAFLPPRVA